MIFSQSCKNDLHPASADDLCRRSLDERAKQKYFGEYSSEYIPNGIVRWIFIEEKILKEIDLPPDDPQLRRVILTALRYFSSHCH